MNTQTHIPPTVTETEAEAIELSLRADYTRPEYPKGWIVDRSMELLPVLYMLDRIEDAEQLEFDWRDICENLVADPTYGEAELEGQLID